MKRRFGNPLQPLQTGVFLFKEYRAINSPEYQLRKVKAELKLFKTKEDLAKARG